MYRHYVLSANVGATSVPLKSSMFQSTFHFRHYRSGEVNVGSDDSLFTQDNLPH